MKKNQLLKISSKILCAILFGLSLNSCKSITITDEPACADIDEVSGFCVYTISEREYKMTGQEWVDFNRRAIKVSPESYGSIKAVLLKLCKKQKDCNYQETKDKLARLEQYIQTSSTTYFINE
jgi:hypothetical protein